MKFKIIDLQTNVGSKWFSDRFLNKEIDLRGSKHSLDVFKEDVQLDAQVVTFGEKSLCIEGYVLDRKSKIGGRIKLALDYADPFKNK